MTTTRTRASTGRTPDNCSRPVAREAEEDPGRRRAPTIGVPKFRTTAGRGDAAREVQPRSAGAEVPRGLEKKPSVEQQVAEPACANW
jgi:hypothetical protein